jgi:hypothetical protein
MIVKFMGPEDGPDNDSRKSCTIFAGVSHVYFERVEEADTENPKALQAVAHMTFGHPEDPSEEFDVWGNVYVMNDAGKTISTFSPTPLIHEEQILS